MMKKLPKVKRKRKSKSTVQVNKVTKMKRSYTTTDLRKVVNEFSEWVQEAPKIDGMLKQGVSLQAIGKQYGVSRQRVYQIMDKLNEVYGFKLHVYRKSDVK
jgi:DNA-directed RNA polymerase sigma subunit (sigma70/sigma32)